MVFVLLLIGFGECPENTYLILRLRRQQHSTTAKAESSRDIYLIREMANFNFYFASCALLLTLSWRTSSGLPVRTLSTEKCKSCSALFRNLLENVTDVLKDGYFCDAVSSDKMVFNSKTDTALACAPTLTQNAGCIILRNSSLQSFNEGECLRNIRQDLAYYHKAIESYLNLELKSTEKETELLNPALEMIKQLKMNCALMPDGDSSSSEEDSAEMWGDGSFNNRQEMCKLLRGLHTRTITISRAMGYISSGDHRK